MRVVNLNSLSFYLISLSLSLWECVCVVRFCIALNGFPLKRTTYTLNNEKLETVKYVAKERNIYTIVRDVPKWASVCVCERKRVLFFECVGMALGCCMAVVLWSQNKLIFHAISTMINFAILYNMHFMFARDVAWVWWLTHREEPQSGRCRERKNGNCNNHISIE